MPKAELAGLNVASHALGGGADQRQFPIMDRPCAVHGDVINMAALHHVDEESGNAGPDDMGTHHENARPIIPPGFYQAAAQDRQGWMRKNRRRCFQRQQDRQIQVVTTVCQGLSTEA